jgi:hypothetical protein
MRGLYIESPLPHPSVVFRTSIMARLGGYRDYDGPEDYDLWLRMAREGVRFMKVRESLLQWRLHPGSLSRQDPRYRKLAFRRRKFEYVGERILNRDVGASRRLRVWGAGKNGRRLAGHLRSIGVPVEAHVDVDPRLVGSDRLPVPVLSPGSVGTDDQDCYYICAVGSWGARRQIRSILAEAGRIEGDDYLIL